MAAAAVAFLAAGPLAPAAALAANPPAPNVKEAGEAGRFGLLIAFCLLIIPTVVGWYVSRSRARRRGSEWLALRFRRLLVGDDNRASTSKTVAVGWTYLLAIGLLSIIATRWLGHGQGFGSVQHSGLEGQYGLLIGGPLGAAIAAKGIVGSQLANNPSVKRLNPDGPSAFDLIANDVGNTDLGDLQYVLFNLVAMVFFVGTMLQSPVSGLPHLPDVLLGLTSVSAVGYAGKKALPPTATATLTPDRAAAITTLSIVGTGLCGNESPPASVRVLFGVVTAQALVNPRVAHDGTDTLTLTTPPGLKAGQVVDVTVITPDGMHVKAGSFTLAP